MIIFSWVLIKFRLILGIRTFSKIKFYENPHTKVAKLEPSNVDEEMETQEENIIEPILDDLPSETSSMREQIRLQEGF